MQWLIKILEQAVVTDGKVDMEGLINAVGREFPKNAVPKDVFNAVNNKLKLSKSTIEGLQNRLDEYEARLKASKEEQSPINKIDLTAVTTSLKPDLEVNIRLQVKRE